MKFRRIRDADGYRVYEDGRITNKAGTRFLRPGLTNTGYPFVVVVDNKGIRRARTVHKIVSKCYLGKRPKGWYVNHKDGVKKNNHWKNLEYVTPSGNMFHSSETRLLPRASKHYSTDLTEKAVRKVCRLIVKGKKNWEIEEATDVPASKIRDIRMCKSWRSVSRDFFEEAVSTSRSRVSAPIKKKVIRAIKVDSSLLNLKKLASVTGLSLPMVRNIANRQTWKAEWSQYG